MLTTDQILAAAPDAQVAAAGKKLADAKHWRNVGADDDALWGECQGSALYQVRVSLATLAAKCTCPSRKFPCKHAVGLLLMHAQNPAARAARPEWVASWLAMRTETAERKTAKAAPDPEGQAKRAAQRHERVLEGLEALDLWMLDLVRNGLAELETKGTAAWDQQAARLVDAQAPALSTRLRALASIAGGADDWAERLLGELGRIALLTHAYRRIDQLSPELQADVRTAIGWTLTEDEVQSTGERIADDWLVLGSITEEGDRVRTQRTWLRGRASGRTALVLQFAAGAAHFAQLLMPGTVIEADLAFWPSAWPQRALIAERRAQRTANLDGDDSFATFLDRNANALAKQPWLWRTGAVIRDLIPRVDTRGTWTVRDRENGVLPLEGRDHWQLLAISGGHPIGLTAEWDGYALTPLAVVNNGVFHRLTGVR